MLSQLRDRTGRPSLQVRLVAVLLALVLAGPLTLLAVRVVTGVLDALY